MKRQPKGMRLIRDGEVVDLLTTNAFRVYEVHFIHLVITAAPFEHHGFWLLFLKRHQNLDGFLDGCVDHKIEFKKNTRSIRASKVKDEMI